jgi:hypothetical protein
LQRRQYATRSFESSGIQQNGKQKNSITQKAIVALLVIFALNIGPPDSPQLLQAWIVGGA